MKKLLALEEAGQLTAALYLFFQVEGHLHGWLLLPAFFAPDLFAIGFLINNRVGTIMYNFSHHKLVCLFLAGVGLVAGSSLVLQSGLIAYAHSSFDRTIGYGLKYIGASDHTHLGFIGKQKFRNPPDHF